MGSVYLHVCMEPTISFVFRTLYGKVKNPIGFLEVLSQRAFRTPAAFNASCEFAFFCSSLLFSFPPSRESLQVGTCPQELPPSRKLSLHVGTERSSLRKRASRVLGAVKNSPITPGSTLWSFQRHGSIQVEDVDVLMGRSTN